MGYYDCDTIPFLWKYAHTFALFDHIFAAMAAPSTPNNVAVIAAQAGQTQWARDPKSATDSGDKGPGVPLVDDIDPAYGPYTELDREKQVSQRYATLMLMLGGSDDAEVTQDTDGVDQDLGATIASLALLGVIGGNRLVLPVARGRQTLRCDSSGHQH